MYLNNKKIMLFLDYFQFLTLSNEIITESDTTEAT